MRLRLLDVLDSTGAELVRGDAGATVSGVSTDTREIAPGSLYVALAGPRFDGNLFAKEALEKGAGALLLRSEQDVPASLPERLPNGRPVALHIDPRRALVDLAAWHRARVTAPVIGVTGSSGKTTTKDVLTQLLSAHRSVIGSPRSFNNDIGVPLTLLLADEGTEALVVEIGTNSPGEIAALCRVAARPTAGIVTNIGAAHLEGLGSLEGVAREKGDLAAAVPADGFVVLNADCRFSRQIASMTAARVITFSVEGEGDLNAHDLVFHAAGTTFRLNGHEVTSPLLGTHNVSNLLAALAACTGLGVPLDEVLPVVQHLAGGHQRMERHALPGGSLVLDDTWNSNPDSARAAVRVLAGLHGHRRRVLILGDMLELGRHAAEMHHEVGLAAAEADLDLVVLVGELAVAAAAGAMDGGLPAERVLHLPDAAAAIERVPSLVEAGDVVLVKASRGLRLERVVQRVVKRLSGEEGGQ
jgi:UDP-N-acetylmuramoyl-tripeptide--D-alanyl-D-alanine ligase